MSTPPLPKASAQPAHCHSGSLVEASSETKPKVKGGPRSLCGRVYELEGQERGHRAVGGGAGGEILYSARVQTACHMDRRDSVDSAGTEWWGSSSNGPVCCSLRFKLHCGPLGTASPGQAAFPPRPTCYLVSYAQTASPAGALEFSSTVVMGNSSLHICRQDLLSLQN